jgi:hypothetical protein
MTGGMCQPGTCQALSSCCTCAVTHPQCHKFSRVTHSHVTPHTQVDAAILKLHTRRVTSLAFHHTSDAHVISGDKKGGIAVWNFMQVCVR